MSFELALATKMAAVQEQIRTEGCSVFEPGTGEYYGVVQIWNGAVPNKPAIVACCLTVSDVQTCLRAAQAHAVPISIRGGGHDWLGR